MKTRTYLIILSLLSLLLSYNFYSNGLKTFRVKDVSKQESFELYKNTDSRPANIDLIVQGQTDTMFNVKVINLPSRFILFDSSFNHKETDYKCKIDYYEGNGIEILYTPKGAVTGKVKISARINIDL